MKIVVTGALGHIGSYLIRNFPQRVPHAEILMIDNLSTQRYPSLFNLEHSVNYRFIEGDVQKMDLVPMLKGATVVHLAAATDASRSVENRSVIEGNFELTKKVAEACIESGADMLFPSTTSVYGTQEDMWMRIVSLKILNHRALMLKLSIEKKSFCVSWACPIICVTLFADLGQSAGLHPECAFIQR